MSDVLSALLILVYLLIASFAWFAPLILLLKSSRKALLASIPISLSVQIIIGYIFYNIEIMSYFPLFYLGLVVLANAFAIAKLRKSNYETISWQNGAKLSVLLVAIILPTLLYTRYFDAISLVAPGNSDTINHLFFLNSIDRIGRIGLSYYAPGLQILTYPLTKLFSSIDIYRFAGPAIGTSFALQTIMFFRQYTKKTSAFLVATVLFLSPLYTQLTLQTIGFWSSSLSFIFLLGIIHLIVAKDISPKAASWLYFVIVCALSFTVPYLLIQLIPAFALFCIILHIYRKRFPRKRVQLAMRLFFILVLGFALAVGHIFIQSKLSGSARVVPTIRIAIEKDDEVATVSSKEIYLFYPGLQKYGKYPLFVKALPALSVGIDLLNLKNVRGLNNALDIGSYAWVILSLLMVFYAIRKKNLNLLAIATLSLMFGFVTETGILEMSYYRGRSGWYLMLLSLLGFIFFFDLIKPKKTVSRALDGILYLAVAVLVVFSFISPPTFYRKYHPQVYRVARSIGKEARNNTAVIYNSVVQQIGLSMVSANIESFSLEDFLSGQHCCDKDKQYYVVLEKKFLNLDPRLSQSALSTDKGYKQFNKKQQELHAQKNLLNQQVRDSENFSNYKAYYEDEDIAVYQLEK